MPAPTPLARGRARLLARRGQASPALVCPLVLTQAAEIEALPPQRFLTDPTKLANGLLALHEALGNDVIVTAAADGLAAEAAGASPVTAHPRAAAAVEATRRLAATADDAALAVALCGPARLAAQLDQAPADPAVLERCGAMLLELARAFLHAGANLLLIVEEETLPAECGDGWRSAATPLVNLARFHQAAAVVVLADPAGAAAAPRGTVVCLPPSDAAAGQGIALSVDPAAWGIPGPGTPLVTTLGPVRGGFAETRAAVALLAATVGEA
ncbi:MAG TPA: hypothetical protein VFA45_10930 [Actinomycetes bacterium]|nr:hypothetical protein [Actinomycetes bacterium]